MGSEAAYDMMEPTFEKMTLILEATPGMMAPAAVATNPAIRAYSMRSWALVSRRESLSFHKSVVARFIPYLSAHVGGIV